MLCASERSEHAHSVAKRGRLGRNAPRTGRGGPAKAIFLWSRAGACPAAEKGAGGD